MSAEGDTRVIRAEDRPHSPSEWLAAAEMVIGVTARAFNVPKESLLLRRRSTADVAFARQVAMYLLHIVFGGTYKEAGDLFGRERTTVAYACSLVEDERDDADLDRKLDLLEESLDRLWAIECLRRARNAKKRAAGQAAA
ncbi:MAG: helix-turn-helix domain-containing protein [Pseudomonadota bacterium]